jgi:hypothetical protein
MPEWLAEAAEFAKPYWPFTTKVLVFWFVGQNLKKRLFTKQRAATGVWWARARGTMWCHPMVAGALWGLMWPWMPAVEWITTRGGAVNEGILAGVTSVAGFMLLEAMAVKYRWAPVLAVLREVGRPSVAPPAPSRGE